MRMVFRGLRTDAGVGCGWHDAIVATNDNGGCDCEFSDFYMLFRPSAHTECAPVAIKNIALMFCLAIGISACTPTFNWREVSFEGLPVTALLPCKPDRGTRQVPLLGAPRAMTMAGCESGGAMFTVAVVNLEDSTRVAAAQAELQAGSKATQSRYFTHGPILVQAAIYGEPKAGSDGPSALSAQVGETFFGGVQVIKK
jgi:hypothetical protein